MVYALVGVLCVAVVILFWAAVIKLVGFAALACVILLLLAVAFICEIIRTLRKSSSPKIGMGQPYKRRERGRRNAVGA